MRAVQRLGFRAEWSWEERVERGLGPFPSYWAASPILGLAQATIVSPSPTPSPLTDSSRAREDGKAGKERR